jgi:hypothetical protein
VRRIDDGRITYLALAGISFRLSSRPSQAGTSWYFSRACCVSCVFLVLVFLVENWASCGDKKRALPY